MAGTKAGGIAAANTMIKKYGEDYFRKIGAVGGTKSKTGGFGNGEIGRELARRASKISRKGKKS